MSHDEGARCFCRMVHAPAPMELQSHHVWPLGMGGPDVPENRVWVCPTVHVNIHELLTWFVKRDEIVDWREVLDAYDVPVSRFAYEYASTGFRRWKAREL